MKPENLLLYSDPEATKNHQAEHGNAVRACRTQPVQKAPFIKLADFGWAVIVAGLA